MPESINEAAAHPINPVGSARVIVILVATKNFFTPNHLLYPFMIFAFLSVILDLPLTISAPAFRGALTTATISRIIIGPEGENICERGYAFRESVPTKVFENLLK